MKKIKVSNLLRIYIFKQKQLKMIKGEKEQDRIRFRIKLICRYWLNIDSRDKRRREMKH